MPYDQADWCYPPIIQSGGKYDLRVSAQSNGDNLHEGTIIASMGIRFKSYCSNIARTYLTNPEKVHAKEAKNHSALVLPLMVQITIAAGEELQFPC